MRKKIRTNVKGITLMEILVVMVIIALLVSAAVPMYRKSRVRALVVKTESLISSLEAGLSCYGTDLGDYPEFDGEGSSILVEQLQGPVESRHWKGPYMRFKSDDVDKNNNVLDAWKTPLSYMYPQDIHSNVPYMIVSAGPDRRFGTDDDIGNW